MLAKKFPGAATGLTVIPIMGMLKRLSGQDPDAKDAITPPGIQSPAA
ncbi:hypothetical protein GTW51_19880 [Aurantimonas aggregata]|uniref:Uncharacterized protein n=1 Tax=Aurantimonas aggregata TaxID=2047720 RepID=A0A6L9MNH1_9HYPH|nr:hypothetical protein [Aurantimonas aggregata]NDV88948.1 hypothetical protein [Aurantimonas aggregata]